MSSDLQFFGIFRGWLTAVFSNRFSFLLWTSVCPTMTFSSSWPLQSPSRLPARRCLLTALLPPTQSLLPHPKTASDRRLKPSSVRKHQPSFSSTLRRSEADEGHREHDGLSSAASPPVTRLLFAVVSTEGQLARLQDLGFKKEDCKTALLHCKGESSLYTDGRTSEQL